MKVRAVRRNSKEHRWSQDCADWVKHTMWNKYQGDPEADGEIPDGKAVEARRQERQELAEKDDLEGLKTQAVLTSLYLEQLTIELGGKGETEVPWFFTGLPVPPYHLTEVNKTVLSEEPFAGLAHPKWVNANLAYIRDLDFFRRRQTEIPKASGPKAEPKQPRRRKVSAKKKKPE